MRAVAALTLTAFAASGAARPDTRDELDALERKLIAAHAAARASVGSVVVSRSDQYPKPAMLPAPPGQLGGFDPAAFLKADPSPARAELAARLDLADPRAIPDHPAAGGVVIDPAGLVLTTFHAVDGATRIYVHLPGGGSYADIHAADGRSDLAVLRLLTPPPGLKAVPFADVRLPDGRAGAVPNVVPGKLVFVAAPFAAGGNPAGGLGSVVGVRRPRAAVPDRARRFRAGVPDVVSQSVYNYGPVVEFDARSGPGCDGSALLTLDGEVLGLTTAVAAVAGDHGLALPLDDNLRRVVEVLRRGEEVEYGFLGVSQGDPIGPTPDGVTVLSVTPRSPAADAGLQPGDRLVRINGYPADSYEDLLLYVGSALAGGKVALRVQRGGEVFTVLVTLAKFRNEVPSIVSSRPDPVLGLRVDYGSLLAQPQGTPSGIPAGVMVRAVVAGGPAAARFVALGDGRWVVTHVNGTPTPTPAEFRAVGKGLAAAKLTVYDPTDPNSRPRDISIP